jgi:hypothetical protein
MHLATCISEIEFCPGDFCLKKMPSSIKNRRFLLKKKVKVGGVTVMLGRRLTCYSGEALSISKGFDSPFWFGRHRCCRRTAADMRFPSQRNALFGGKHWIEVDWLSQTS